MIPSSARPANAPATYAAQRRSGGASVSSVGDPRGEHHAAERDRDRGDHPQPQLVVAEQGVGQREQVGQRLPRRRRVGVERALGASGGPTPASRRGRSPAASAPTPTNSAASSSTAIAISGSGRAADRDRRGGDRRELPAPAAGPGAVLTSDWPRVSQRRIETPPRLSPRLKHASTRSRRRRGADASTRSNRQPVSAPRRKMFLVACLAVTTRDGRSPRGSAAERGAHDRQCPRQESNLHPALRRRVLYPLSYEGGSRLRVSGRRAGVAQRSSYLGNSIVAGGLGPK